jgi:hypothetical protein
LLPSSPVTSLHLTPFAPLRAPLAPQEPGPSPPRQLTRKDERQLLLALSTVTSGHLPPVYNHFFAVVWLGLDVGEQDDTTMGPGGADLWIGSGTASSFSSFFFFCFTVNPPMKLHIIGKFSLASPTIILSVTSSTIIVLSLTAGDW